MAEVGQNSRFRLPARGWSFLLIFSLCLNLLIIGTAATVWWRWSFAHPRGAEFFMREDGRGAGHHGGYGFGLGRGPLNPHVMASLAPEKREKIKALVLAHHDRVQQLRRAAFAARRQASDALAAPDYTPQKFAAALDLVRQADAALESEVLATMKDCAAELSPQERQAIAHIRMEGGMGGPGPAPGSGHGLAGWHGQPAAGNDGRH